MFFQSTRDAWVAISPRSDQEQHQENAADANAARRLAVALGLFVFDQLEHAPQDQQRRPEAREQRAEVVDVHDPHRPQQEQHSHQDQHDGPGDRTMRRRGGIGGGGGGMIGLATVHLTGRRNWWNGWRRRSRPAPELRPSRRIRSRMVSASERNVSFRRCASLQQLESRRSPAELPARCD